MAIQPPEGALSEVEELAMPQVGHIVPQSYLASSASKSSNPRRRSSSTSCSPTSKVTSPSWLMGLRGSADGRWHYGRTGPGGRRCSAVPCLNAVPVHEITPYLEGLAAAEQVEHVSWGHVRTISAHLRVLDTLPEPPSRPCSPTILFILFRSFHHLEIQRKSLNTFSVHCPFAPRARVSRVPSSES